MTPLAIEIMLHYFYSTNDHRHATSTLPSTDDTFKLLVEDALLEIRKVPGSSGYVITERGRAYVKFLTEMKLPICVTKWVLPNA